MQPPCFEYVSSRSLTSFLLLSFSEILIILDTAASPRSIPMVGFACPESHYRNNIVLALLRKIKKNCIKLHVFRSVTYSEHVAIETNTATVPSPFSQEHNIHCRLYH
jgi:hypothetical protein